MTKKPIQKIKDHESEGTHWACPKNLAESGGQAGCCECIGHACEPKEVSDPNINNIYDKIKPQSDTGCRDDGCIKNHNHLGQHWEEMKEVSDTGCKCKYYEGIAACTHSTALTEDTGCRYKDHPFHKSWGCDCTPEKPQSSCGNHPDVFYGKDVEPQSECKHGEPVYWNPYNKVVQCHKCGQVFKPTSEMNLLPEKPQSECKCWFDNGELIAKHMDCNIHEIKPTKTSTSQACLEEEASDGEPTQDSWEIKRQGMIDEFGATWIKESDVDNELLKQRQEIIEWLKENDFEACDCRCHDLLERLEK